MVNMHEANPEDMHFLMPNFLMPNPFNFILMPYQQMPGR